MSARFAGRSVASLRLYAAVATQKVSPFRRRADRARGDVQLKRLSCDQRNPERVFTPEQEWGIKVSRASGQHTYEQLCLWTQPGKLPWDLRADQGSSRCATDPKPVVLRSQMLTHIGR